MVRWICAWTRSELTRTSGCKYLVRSTASGDFGTYGEEPKAAQIARLVVQARPLETTTQLAAVAAKAWPGHSRVHPATGRFKPLELRLMTS